MPEDGSPPTGRLVAADQRIAWLLATTRLLGRDGELAHQSEFAHALRDVGFQVDNSRISRWESGIAVLPAKVIAAYEGLLGAPDASLVALASLVHRSRTGDANRARAVREPVALEVLDASFEALDAGEVTGAVWLRLAEGLAAQERIYLNATTWRGLSERLVRELSRSVGAARTRRSEAARLLLANPTARRHVVRAIGVVVTHPDAQVVHPALALLGDVTDPAAGDLVLRMLEGQNPLLRQAAARIVPGKVARGDVAVGALPQVETHAAHTLRSDHLVADDPHAFDLIASLPAANCRRVCAMVTDPQHLETINLARATGHLAPVDSVRSVSRSLASRAQGATRTAQGADPDTMLQRLLADALFHVHEERRHLAGMLIGASVYAPAVADELGALAEGGSEFTAVRALRALVDIGVHGARSRLLRRATDTRASATTAAVALDAVAASREALSRTDADTIESLLAASVALPVRNAALRALGMQASPRMTVLAESDDPWLAERASWWREHGGALRDIDDAVPPHPDSAEETDVDIPLVPAPRRG